ncbi:MAG: (Fe-S) protein, partial [Candidatus Accumulibacter sp.]
MPTERDDAPRAPLAQALAPPCGDCRYAATLLAGGACDPAAVCVRALSGQRIDRFFRRHPQEAASWLDDGFWERRAIAARYAPLPAVTALTADADEVVRRVVASRLP